MRSMLHINKRFEESIEFDFKNLTRNTFGKQQIWNEYWKLKSRYDHKIQNE